MAINQATNKAMGTVAEITGKAKTSVSEAASQAADKLSQTTNKAVVTVVEVTEKTKNSIASNTSNTINTITEATTQAARNITDVTENAKASLEQSIQKAENLRFSLTEGIEAGITSFVNNWFNDHPILFWILNHPIHDLGILLLVIFLFWGLLKAIGRLVEKAWISVIIAPFKLIQSFLGIGSKSLGNVMVSGLVTVPSNQTLNQGDRKEDMANIINQLNALKQQQDKLLQELATILESDDLKVK
ncbi:MAG TPA: hypothetical protein DCY88_08910 [Cyanobacteria bacterium UBA11372]|nr:hypothetical protein [Cyanobacteria bacterium UBA11372]